MRSRTRAQRDGPLCALERLAEFQPHPRLARRLGDCHRAIRANSRSAPNAYGRAFRQRSVRFAACSFALLLRVHATRAGTRAAAHTATVHSAPLRTHSRLLLLHRSGSYSDSKSRFDRSVRAKGLGSDIRFVGRAGIERLLRSHGKALIHPIELASLRRLYEEFLVQLQSLTATATAEGSGGGAPETRPSPRSGKSPRRTMVAVLRDLVAVLRASHLDAYPAVAKCWCYPSRVALVAARQLMLQLAEDSADLLISPMRLVGAFGAERNVKELLQSLLVEVLGRGEMSFTTTAFGAQSGNGGAADKARAQWSAKQHRMRPLTVEARAKKDREEDLAFLLHCRHLALRAVVVANNAMLSSRFISPRQRKFIATVLGSTVMRLPALHIAVFEAMELTLPPLPPTTISSRALALSGAERGKNRTPAKAVS